jgi:hypothetical protein
MMMPVFPIVVMRVMLIVVPAVPCAVVVIVPAMVISMFIDDLDAWPEDQGGGAEHDRGRSRRLGRGNHAARDQNRNCHGAKIDREIPH